jgi:hypothetical protein
MMREMQPIQENRWCIQEKLIGLLWLLCVASWNLGMLFDMRGGWLDKAGAWLCLSSWYGTAVVGLTAGINASVVLWRKKSRRRALLLLLLAIASPLIFWLELEAFGTLR